MSKPLNLIFLALLTWGCAPSSSIRLQDINPSRSYNSQYTKVLDAIRIFAVREGFKLDRYETEYGTIIAHKTDTGGGRKQTGLDAMSQVIVMKLSVKKQAESRTDLTASFSFGGVHSSQTKEDEDMLAYNYTSLFNFLESQLKE